MNISPILRQRHRLLKQNSKLKNRVPIPIGPSSASRCASAEAPRVRADKEPPLRHRRAYARVRMWYILRSSGRSERAGVVNRARRVKVRTYAHRRAFFVRPVAAGFPRPAGLPRKGASSGRVCPPENLPPRLYCAVVPTRCGRACLPAASWAGGNARMNSATEAEAVAFSAVG